MSKTKEITVWHVIDWRNEKVRTRKTEYDATGPYEQVQKQTFEITIPDPELEELHTELDVPMAQVNRVVSESLFDEEYPEWMATVDQILSDTPHDELTFPEDARRVLGEAMLSSPGHPDPDEVHEYIREQISEINEMREDDDG